MWRTREPLRLDLVFSECPPIVPPRAHAAPRSISTLEMLQIFTACGLLEAIDKPIGNTGTTSTLKSLTLATNRLDEFLVVIDVTVKGP